MYMGTQGHAEVSFFDFPFRQFTLFQRVSNRRSFSFPLRGWSLLNVVLLVYLSILAIRERRHPPFWQASSSCFEFLENIFWCILSRSTLYLVRVHKPWRVVKMPLSQRHLHPTRKGASNFILEGQVGKIVIWPLVYDPFSRQHYCLLILPVTP